MERIRVLIGLLGLDQHEVGAVAVSRLLRDAGFEVVYTGRFNTPPGIVQTSIEEGADIIGLSCHSWEYLHYVPELMRLLKEKEMDVPVVVGGSVITPGDSAKLEEMGVAASFGPSATGDDIIQALQGLAPGRD